MTTPAQRLESLRHAMRAQGMDAYVVPNADYHGSEYVAPHFRTLAYLSGFTGSAGTLLVLQTGAYLWTDGRYFLQAEEQLGGSGVELMRMGAPGVPALQAFLCAHMPEDGVLGFDGRTLDAKTARALAGALGDKRITLRCDAGLLGPLWPDRPPLPDAPLWLLQEGSCGESAQSKLDWLRAQMQTHAAEVCALCNCEDVAYLFNLRGGDLPHTPAPLCYCFVEREKAYLFVDEAKRTPEVDAALMALGVEFRPYEGVYGFAHRYGEGTSVLLDAARVNYALWDILGEKAILLDQPDLIARRRMIKNPTEIQNLRATHVMDGVALTRFMHWLKKSVGKRALSELSAAARLDAERLSQEDCLGLSFDTICGYGPHAAVIHYTATPQSDAALLPRGLLLVDSGAQYYHGTTDVTRTYALGPLTEEEKRHYTLVLKGMLALMCARFPAGTTGRQLDVLARAPIWAEGLDYRHGTGHGVGYVLGVHEDPVRIRNAAENFALAPGMVVSDEPGLYMPQSHGVRLENQLLCVEDIRNEYGAFLRFESLTLAPLDLEAVDITLLSDAEKRALNEYHERVYTSLAPYFGGEMLLWLREVTRPL